MEQSIGSLAFNGSIAEAINEAKKQKKLFLVYISGQDNESLRLATYTWSDLNVAETLSKYCIFLHIIEGSTDSAFFSAIYPQKSTPCITAIGYNGVQLWQNEGFVNAETLAYSLETAWLGLHIQETTATVLSAALATNNSKPHPSGVPDTVAFEQGSSSSTTTASPSVSKHVKSADTRSVADVQTAKDTKGAEDAAEESFSAPTVEASSASITDLEIREGEQAISLTETAKDLVSPPKLDLNNNGVGPCSLKDKDVIPEADTNVVDSHSKVTKERSRSIPNEVVQNKKAAVIADDEASRRDVSANKSTDVHLNIRLPSGTNLQEKFSVGCPLRMVKDYVDGNLESAIGSYDLAIPYPRKVFDNQDLSKTFSELGLFSRQALMVVPHQQARSHHPREGSALPNLANSSVDVDSSNGREGGGGGGYFSHIKTMLSYVNPLSYLGGGSANPSNSVQESQSSMWQYSPNPAIQNNNVRSSPYQGAAPPTKNNASTRKRQPTSSSSFGSGSNIHTLKHDEDDDQFKNRNAFWNGNSTQYGGDDNNNKDD